MIIYPPLCITSRLLPGCRIGEAEISIEYSNIPGKGNRQRYRYFIDNATGYNYRSADLEYAPGGGTLQEGLETLFIYLLAFTKAIKYGEATGRETENMSLFPAELEDWVIENADEINIMESELRDKQLIEE